MSTAHSDRRTDGSDTPGEDRPIGSLISDLTQQVTDLVRKEVQLLRAEVSDKARQAGRGVGEIAAGGVCLLAALLILLQALVVALAELIGPAWAALAVGVGVALLGVLLLQMGQRSLKASHLAPERTSEQLRHDADMARDSLK
jgi:hypothetical protein